MAKVDRAALRTALRTAFALSVRSLRLAAKISQERLAVESGMDRGHVFALEQGRHYPTLETIYKLAPRLGVSPARFMEVVDQEVKKIMAQAHRERDGSKDG